MSLELLRSLNLSACQEELLVRQGLALLKPRLLLHCHEGELIEDG